MSRFISTGLPYAVSIKNAEERDQTPDFLSVVFADTLEQLSEKIGEILDDLNIKHGEISHGPCYGTDHRMKLCLDIDNDTVLVFAGWDERYDATLSIDEGDDQ